LGSATSEFGRYVTGTRKRPSFLLSAAPGQRLGQRVWYAACYQAGWCRAGWRILYREEWDRLVVSRLHRGLGTRHRRRDVSWRSRPRSRQAPRQCAGDTRSATHVQRGWRLNYKIAPRPDVKP